MIANGVRIGVGSAILVLGALLFLWGIYRKRGKVKHDLTDSTNKELNVSTNRGMFMIYGAIAMLIVGISFITIPF